MLWKHGPYYLVMKTIITHHAIVVKDDLILTFDITSVDLWHHANVRRWYCDFIFVDWSCMHKLAQSWYGSGHEGAAVLLPGFAIKW